MTQFSYSYSNVFIHVFQPVLSFTQNQVYDLFRDKCAATHCGAQLSKIHMNTSLILWNLFSESSNKKNNLVFRGIPSAESSRSVRGLRKGVSGKPYPRLCNARRPRLEPGTFRSQAVRLYRLHQARPGYAHRLQYGNVVPEARVESARYHHHAWSFELIDELR